MSWRRRPKRFGIKIIDVFGSTEGAIALDRTGGPPRGSVGRLRQGIAVVDPDGRRGPQSALRRRGPSGQRRAVCRRDRQHPRSGAVRGVLPQRGSDAPHHPQRLVLERRPRVRRRGRLGVLRRSDLRLAAGGRRELPGRSDRGHRRPPPRRHDGLGLRRARRRFRRSGDGGAGAPRRRHASTAESFAAWLDEQSDLSPKWRPRFVRQCKALPTTPTNKVLTRTLVHEKFRSDLVGGDPVFVRTREHDVYRVFTSEDEEALRTAFEASGRSRAWEL